MSRRTTITNPTVAAEVISNEVQSVAAEIVMTPEEITQAQANLDAALKADDEAAKAGTNSTDAIALEIAAMLNSTEASDPAAIWAKISQLAGSKIDESTIADLSLLSDTEIMRRLRLLWSKRVAAKKSNDLLALEDIAAKEAELQSHRTAKISRRSNVVSSESDPTTLTQEQLNKLIRNVQSKKCGAKKAGNEVDVAKYQAEEDHLKSLRTGEPKVTTPTAMNSKIASTIAELEKLPKSDVVDAQILMLKSLL